MSLIETFRTLRLSNLSLALIIGFVLEKLGIVVDDDIDIVDCTPDSTTKPLAKLVGCSGSQYEIKTKTKATVRRVILLSNLSRIDSMWYPQQVGVSNERKD